jgi:hypothetical protein
MQNSQFEKTFIEGVLGDSERFFLEQCNLVREVQIKCYRDAYVEENFQIVSEHLNKARRSTSAGIAAAVKRTKIFFCNEFLEMEKERLDLTMSLAYLFYKEVLGRGVHSKELMIWSTPGRKSSDRSQDKEKVIELAKHAKQQLPLLLMSIETIKKQTYTNIQSEKDALYKQILDNHPDLRKKV